MIPIEKMEFLAGKIKRRIAEQENNARMHPETTAVHNAEVRVAAYRCVLKDVEDVIAESLPAGLSAEGAP